MNEWVNITVELFEVLPVTLEIMVLSSFFALVLGLLLALAKLSKNPLLRLLVTFYVSFMRCTPTLIQLYLFFYGLPLLTKLILKVDVNDWPPEIFAISAFSLHCAAYLSEVIRAAYLAVGRGQQEAAYSVGMSNFQALRRIILPQAFGVALPNISNNLIILLKETSLAFSIGITDLMGKVNVISGATQGTNQLELYIVISLIYWGLCILIETGSGFLENVYTRGHKGIAG